MLPGLNAVALMSGVHFIFPAVIITSQGENPVTTNHTLTLPAGAQSGDLIIALLSIRGGRTFTWPAGWTVLYDRNSGGGADVQAAATYREVDGTEGASIVVQTNSTGVASTYLVYLIRGHTAVPEAATSVGEGTGNPDPPSLSPSWGEAKTLWLAYAAMSQNDGFTAFPTDYTDGFQEPHATAGIASASARRELESATENPGIFTMAVAANRVAATIAIKGAA